MIREKDKIILSVEEYANIIRDLEKLMTLEFYGVDKWENYHFAKEKFECLCEMGDEEVLDFFK